MKISLIAAMDENRLIGRNDALPWHLPADMQWFRKQTMGKPILMGRKTFDSIGKPLPGRTNLVLSRQPDLKIEGCTVVRSLEAAIEAVPGAEEMMVIGGAQIYASLLPQADRLYLTHIQAAFEGDAWFPAYDASQWQESFSETHGPDEKNPYAYRFTVLERRGS
jgi:dihydrofolate reductase